MNLFPILLLVVTISTPTLVLRDGTRIDVDGSVKSENGKVTFRSHGALFSLPVADVDLDATRAASGPAQPKETKIAKEPNGLAEKTSTKIKVSDEEKERLLREIEKNHSGTPNPPAQVNVIAPPVEKTADEKKAEEWKWRKEARIYLEAVKQAKEELTLLQQQREKLRNEIAGFLNLGYGPQQISYQTTRLARVEEQLPRAELELTRAQRAYDQFFEDARRQGAKPGWLD